MIERYALNSNNSLTQSEFEEATQSIIFCLSSDECVLKSTHDDHDEEEDHDDDDEDHDDEHEHDDDEDHDDHDDEEEEHHDDDHDDDHEAHGDHDDDHDHDDEDEDDHHDHDHEDEDEDDHVDIKVICAIILTLETVIGACIPYFLSSKSDKNYWLSFVNCFSGGVFLMTG